MLKKYIDGYTPDYPEICKYEKEFRYKKKDLYYRVYKELNNKSDFNLQEIETLLKISLKEIDLLNFFSLPLSLLVLYLTIVKDIFMKFGTWVLGIFIIIIALLVLFVGRFVVISINYYKYYTFLLNLLGNIKKNKKN